jgi:hypothetical protein
MTMMLYALQLAAALVVLAEALNKIERADLFAGRNGLRDRALAALWLLAPWGWKRPHVVTVFKVLGWALLSIGSAGAVLEPPSGPDVAVLCGFALLIVRSRVKEG